MYRLSDDLAKAKLLYPSPLITAPSVLVIDVPPVNRGSGLALNRYYPIVLETDQEIDEMEHFVSQPRREPVPPDLFDLRPSQIRSDHVLIVRYEPPMTGSPWLLICRWPNDRRVAHPFFDVSLARGCYTMDMFCSETELDARQVELLNSLS